MISLLAFDSLGDPHEFGCDCPTDDMDPPGLNDILQFHPSLSRASLALPPFPERPAPRLGQIVWPCWGVTRYAVGHVLMTGKNLTALKAAVDGWDWDEYRYVQVQFTDDRAEPFAVPMFVVGIRPVNDRREVASVDVEDSNSQLLILTLVDRRWFYGDQRSTTNNDTWGNIVNLAAYAYTMPSAATINTLLAGGSPDYPVPADQWRSSSHYNAPAMLQADAAAAATNLRIVPLGDELDTAEVHDAAAAIAAWDTWWSTWGPTSLSGGLIDQAISAPESLSFVFSADAAVDQPVFGQVPTVAQLNTGTGLSNNDAFLSIDVPYLWASGDREDYRDRFKADMLDWFAAGGAQAKFAGLIPHPVSGVPYAVVWTSRKNEVTTRIDRGPLNYPWPLLSPRWRDVPYKDTHTTQGIPVSDLSVGDNATACQVQLQPGNYILTASVDAELAVSGGSMVVLTGFIYDDTAANYVSESPFHIVKALAGESNSGSGTRSVPYTITEASTLSVRINRNDIGSPVSVYAKYGIFGQGWATGITLTAHKL